MWLAATLALGASGIAQQAQQPTAAETAPAAFLPGEARELTLDPGQSLKLGVTVPAGQMAVLTLEQRGGMSGMTVLDSGTSNTPAQAYASDGGQGSKARVALLGGERATGYVVTCKTREKRRAALAVISLSAVSAPSEVDRRLAAAETQYARAEAIRRGTVHAEPVEAAALYDAAIAAAENLEGGVSAVSSPAMLERRAWTGKARLLMYREENYIGAEQAARRAVDVAAGKGTAGESLAEAGEMALAWKTYSSALALLNRYDEAVETSMQALALYEQTGDEYWQGVVVGNLAFVYRETGQTEKAMEAAEQSLRLAEKQKDDYGRAFALSAEGAISQGSGDYQAALDRYYRALEVVAELKKTQPHPQVEGEVWSNIGEIYADLGDWEQAEDAYRHAVPALEASADGVNEIEVEGRLAGAEIHAGKLQEAEKDYSAALKKADNEGLTRQKTHLLTGLARAETAMGEAAGRPDSQFAAAKGHFEQAATEARGIQQIDGEAEALSGLGDLLSENGRRAEARETYARSAELWEKIPNALEVARAKANLARLDRQDGQLERANAEIFAALDRVEQARATLASESLRTSYFSSRHAFYELAVDVLMDLEARDPGTGYAAQAWAVAERARARTLLDELAAGATTSKLDERQQALELRIRETEDRLAHLSTKKEDAALAEAAGLELHQLLLEADRAAQEARSHRLENAANTGLVAESTTGATESPKDSGAGSLVREALGGDTALYEYWTGVQRSYLWVIRPGTADGGMKAYILPGSAALHERVSGYLAAVMERERDVAGESAGARERRLAAADRQANGMGGDLGRLLVPEESLATPGLLRRLVVVPDGPLEELPYAALRLSGRGVESGRGRVDSGSRDNVASYLIDQYELVEEPSTAAFVKLARMERPADRARSERVAVVADPVYSKTDPRLQSVSGKPDSARLELEPAVLRQAGEGGGLRQLPRLPGSKREAMGIREIAGPARTTLFLDFDASPSILTTTDWSRYRVLHIAAHAIANDEQPELLGIALSMVRQDGTAVNGVVRLHDVYGLHTPVELVVLSACSTSGGKAITGEGVEGLARAFLVAGARSVLATQWGADDASTSELMQSFYSSYLRGGETSPAALRAAQRRLIASPRHAAPYYWAGVVLEGGWQAR